MRYFWVALFLLVPIAGVAVFVIAAASENAWLPENISTVGEDIDHLFYVILGITGFFFVATESLLVYAMFASRGREDGRAAYVHGNNYLEVGWTAMTAAVLLFVAFYQVPAWSKAKYRSSIPRNPDGSVQDVHALVTGSQFLWQIRYPLLNTKLDPKDADLRQSFEMINELHVPAGKDVLLYVTSRDVIHSVFLPNVRVKQDTLPGHVIPVWFKIDPQKLPPAKAGTDEAKHRWREYDWYCAELCGWGHFRMRARLFVHESPETYQKWLARQTERFKTGQPLQGPSTED